MVELEEKYIDKMFEMGDIENLKANDLKQFIRKRTNEKLAGTWVILIRDVILITIEGCCK